ncbi:MAG: metallophosphatase family protein [Acidobacteriota bacterium]|nr:metallophosphatase family protein [Acidobacteriota bacterium]
MRTAIVSDIHGNRTAFHAVLADLRDAAPDLILHGGDLADSGSSPIEIVDHIRDLGWPGIAGNTDEMLHRPEALTEFSNQAPQLAALFAALEEMAAWTRDALGETRIAWLRDLPRTHFHHDFALVHASPDSLWRAPAHTASDAELESLYRPLDRALAVYAHIHRPFIRSVPGFTIANTGSAGLSYDGDPRAAYLLLDDSIPTIRRVEYDINREIQALTDSPLPHADWIVATLQAAAPVATPATTQSPSSFPG